MLEKHTMYLHICTYIICTYDILILCELVHLFTRVQDKAAEDIISIIRRHPEHYVLIGMDTLGKEELLCAIHDALGDAKVYSY